MITQDLMRVNYQGYNGHCLNSDSTRTAQFGALASVLIHLRTSVPPSNEEVMTYTERPI